MVLEISPDPRRGFRGKQLPLDSLGIFEDILKPLKSLKGRVEKVPDSLLQEKYLRIFEEPEGGYTDTSREMTGEIMAISAIVKSLVMN